jgi:ornithine cyclodeaminase
LLDAETGAIAALLEGTSLTAIRTGATSGLGTGLLARSAARRVALIGSGVQARTQLEAVCCVRKIEAVTDSRPRAMRSGLRVRWRAWERFLRPSL